VQAITSRAYGEPSVIHSEKRSYWSRAVRAFGAVMVAADTSGVPGDRRQAGYAAGRSALSNMVMSPPAAARLRSSEQLAGAGLAQ
jgi:hypothetical protein